MKYILLAPFLLLLSGRWQDGKMVLHNCPTCKVAPRPLTPAPTITHPKGTH